MYELQRNTPKHPVTKEEIAAALDEWYDNGQKGLESFCRDVAPEAEHKVTYWFEKGRARFNVFLEAILKLP